jgi:glucose/arabinose dehydrogenase
MNNMAKRSVRIALILLLCNLAPNLDAQNITSWASGLTKPIGIASAGDTRLFIVEQAGLIKILDGKNNVLPAPFLNVKDIVLSGGERGLLNLAFHPNYKSNGLFYIYYTNLNGDVDISEYTVSNDPNVANPTGSVILTIPHPHFANHNGGGLAFGPDGYLYLAVGDGGSGGDPNENAQNLGLLLGKILRIDVTGSQEPQLIDFNNAADIASWNVKKGVWDTISGSLHTETNKKSEIISNIVSCKGTLEVDLKPQTAGARISLLMCYQDNQNYTEIRLLEDKDKIHMRRFSNGKKTADEKANLPISIQAFTHLRVTFDGSQFLLFVGSATDPLIRMPSGASAGGGPGIRVKSVKGVAAVADIDNLQVTSPYGIPPTNPFVGNSAARDEIWAYGLRNPWRISFDRLTGDLFVGDVGQNCYEEVDFQGSNDSGGRNYGWDVAEGRMCYDEPGGSACNLPPSGCGFASFDGPILIYDHNDGAVCAVTGGYRYRGSAVSSLSGKYLFGDFCAGRVYAASENAGNWNVNFAKPLFDIENFSVTTFGEDASGELYFADAANGILYKITP